MERRFILLKVVASCICLFPQSSQEIQSGDRHFLSNFSANNSKHDETKGVVHLFNCPGHSSAKKNKGVQNISNEFFSKYGFLDPIEHFMLTVRFSEREPDCAVDSVSTSTQLSITSNHISSNITTTGDDQGHNMLTHGWILKYYSTDYWDSIPPNKYCILDLDVDDKFSIKYCRSNCSTQPCISKCCPANEVCDLQSSSTGCHCTDSGAKKWTTTVEHFSQSNYSFVHHLFYESCATVHFALNKNSSSNLKSSYRNDFNIDKNGSVHFYTSDDTWITLASGKYCVDGAAESHPTNVGGPVNFSGHLSDMILLSCRSTIDITPQELDRQQFILYTILVPFAIVFLLLTIIVYILTWQTQNIHGYTNFCYLVTLLVLYVFVVLGNMRSIIHPNNYPRLCTFLAGAIHYSYLSSVCFVTCISFDVWRTFQKMSRVAVQSRRKRRFAMFCAFSCGYPLLQVSLCAAFDVIYRDTPPDAVSVVLPKYGTFACSISNKGATYYLFVPVTVLLMCNSGFFVATILSMIRYKTSIREAFAEISNSVNPSKANQSFGIYTRLFIIMGIFWISQIVSWFVLLDEKNSTRLEILFAIPDALTVLQAVAIFYIFVCKKCVFAKLWNLQPWLRPLLLLWVKNGCCTIPSSSHTRIKRINVLQSSALKMGRVETCKRTNDNNNALNNRNSKDSNSSTGMVKKSASNRENLERHISATSDGSCVTTTTTTDLDDGLVLVGSFKSESAEITTN